MAQVVQTLQTHKGKQQARFREAVLVLLQDLVKVGVLVIVGRDRAIVVADFQSLQQLCILEVWLFFGRDEGNESFVELSPLDVKQILGNAVKEVVCENNKRIFQRLQRDRFPRVEELQFLVFFDIKTRKVENALFEEGLERRVRSPEVQILLGKVTHHVLDRNILEDRLGIMGKKFLEEMVGEAAGTRAEFEDINGLFGVEGSLFVAFTVSQKPKDDFTVGAGNEGIAGGVVRDFPRIPRLNPLLLEELSLKRPQKRLREAFLLL